MTRATSVSLLLMSVLTGCGPDSPVPYVHCDDVTFLDVSESIPLAGGLVVMDATEVTQGQYQLFLDATAGGTDVSGQATYCEWNTTYAADPECQIGRLADERMLEDVLACDSRTQTCVDWCDASMYCEWVGKRLCGSQEGRRVALDAASTLRSEWYFACSAGGGDPYGAGSFERTSASCNTLECYSSGTCVFPTELVTSGAPVAPGSMPNCQSPDPRYAGVYDLTGNMAEWDNSCDAELGPNDQCVARGGSWSSGPQPCDVTPTRARSDRSATLGFRCCNTEL